MANDDIFFENDVIFDVELENVYIIDQGAITKVVAHKYSPESVYNIGDYVIYIDELYKCTVDILTPEEFDSSKWTKLLVVDEIKRIYSILPTKADANSVYTKTETNALLDNKADKSTTYTKTEVDNSLNLKADRSTTYTKTEVDNALDLKADKSTTYTKTEIDGKVDQINADISTKADKSSVYTKTEIEEIVEDIDQDISDLDETKADKATTYTKEQVDNIINNLPAPMIFKGTIGTGGTITTLPTASSENEGFTYKVITDGTYAGIPAKVGDMFTSNGTAWIHIPSGDETFTDTWRGIKINGIEQLTSSIGSGDVDFVNGTNSTISFDASGNKIKINVDGYTQSQIDTKLQEKANTSDVYTKTETYTKTEVNNIASTKADKSTTYTKTEVDNALNLKADKATTYTKTEVDEKFEDIEPINTASGAIASFETNLSDNVVELTAEINPVQSGSGTPSPENERPISGFTECNIVDCGVNLWDYSVTSSSGITAVKNEDGSITLSGIATADAYVTTINNTVVGAGTYTFSAVGASGNIQLIYTQDGNYGGRVNPTLTRTFTEPSTIGGYIRVLNGTDLSTPVTIYPQMEVGSTASPYEPYNGNLVTVAFGQTVYGGVLTCKNGAWKVSATHTVEYLKDKDWNNYEASGQQIFRCKAETIKPAESRSDIISNMFELVAPTGTPMSSGQMRNYYFNVYNLEFYVDNITTMTDWTDFITSNNVTICVPLATPIEIDLTAEHEQVATLVGLNNVFHDANGEIEVEYLTGSAGDIKKVIETTKFADLSDIPNPPSTDGTYRLKVTIADGKATYTWELIE